MRQLGFFEREERQEAFFFREQAARAFLGEATRFFFRERRGS